MGAINTAFVQQFSSNIITMSQQRGSKLRNAVLVKTGIVGEDWYIDQLDATTARTKTTRNADVEYSSSDYQRRKLSPKCLYDAKLIDKEDKVRMLADPTNAEAQGLAFAIGRGLDDLLITAAFGSAWYGVAGASEETFSSNNVVAVAGAGLTLAKLLAAKEILDAYDVDDEEPRYMAISAKQIQDLLKITEFTSADYNTQRTLAVSGNQFSFCGFTFIKISTALLDTDSNSYRRVIAWAKNGLGLGIAAEMKNSIDVLPAKHYATQVYCAVDAGATRVDMDKVVEIKCNET
jgi:hypothetical protein